jgi:hypothetical protein
MSQVLGEVRLAGTPRHVRRGVGWSEDNEELLVVGSLAEAYCSDPSFHAAAENIQIHGGIGFTGELPAHLYCKRAKRSEIRLGDVTSHPRAPGAANRNRGPRRRIRAGVRPLGGRVARPWDSRPGAIAG